MTGPETKLRLLVLCAGEPTAERPFSGSAKNLLDALERRGVVHHKANVLGYSDPFAHGPLPLRLYRKLERRLPIHLEECYQWSALCFRRNSARAKKIAQEHPGYNACLMYGTTFRAPFDVPSYCYFDATVAQVSRADGWEFADMAPAQKARIQAYQNAVFAACTAVFPRSKWAAASLRTDYGMNDSKISVAGAGPNHQVAPLPHAAYDAKRILFIGSEFERKGGPLLLDAFRRLRAEMPDATLAIVGCTPDLDEPGVEILGRISKDAPGGLERLLEEYSRASLFCIMSDFEPFGIVVLEAQHCFVPCVLPARFAFPEMIVDGETGRLVPEYDAGALAALWQDLLRAPERLAEMGQAGHAFVARDWTWSTAAARIVMRMEEDLKERTQDSACRIR